MYTYLLRAAALAAALLPPVAGAAPLTLETALDAAVQRSEAARSGRASLQSASEAARAAGQLPDPTLNVGVDNLPVTGPDRLSTTRDSMTMKSIGFSQEWVSAEKRSARQSAAQAVANRQAVLARAAIADTRLQTALAYLDAFYASEALKLTTLTEHHAHEELQAARGRLASSTESSQEVLALTGARGSAEDESAEVEQQRSAYTVQLERWVGMPANDLTPPDERSLPAEQDYVDGYPAVVALQRDVDVAKQEAAVSATNRNPNWTWAVSYGQRTGYSDMLTFGVSIPIPLSPTERQDRDTSAMLALVDKAGADLAEATRAAAAEYRGLLSDVSRLQERIERYRSGVVTPAGQRVSVAMASYGSNQTNLVTLFEARHAEVDAQRKLLMLQRDLAKAKARLTYKSLCLGADQ